MRRVIASGWVAVVGVVLWVVPATATGNSSSTGEAAKSPSTILTDAKAATDASATVTISGTVLSGGKRTSLNVVSAHGAGGGTVTSDGATFSIVVAPPNLYLKADKASWTKLARSAAVGQLLADKWLQTTTTNKDFASIAAVFDAATLTAPLTVTATVTKGAVTTFHGVKALSLKGGKHGTVYVAATGTAYILGVVGTGANKGNQVLFTQYGSAKVPSAPSNAISLSQLTQASNGSQ